MAWYYNRTSRVLSVSVGNGEVVAVKPHHHVWIENNQLQVEEIKKVISFGKLQRTSAPKGVLKQFPPNPIESSRIEIETDFASSVEDLGRANITRK